MLTDVGDGGVILFDTAVFHCAAPVTISLASALPSIIADGVRIDASDADAVVDGTAMPDVSAFEPSVLESSGIVVDASGVTIRGLQIVNFPYYGVEIRGGRDNMIGGDRLSGCGPMGQGNLIIGNCYGVQVVGSDAVSNTILGNYIGTDVSGTRPVTGRCGFTEGMQIAGDYNRVGGTGGGERSVIAGSVGLSPPNTEPSHHQIAGNYIGVDATGTACIGNGWSGVSAWGSHHTIGGLAPEEGNAICGFASGIYINGSSNLVANNEIYGNTREGVRMTGETSLYNTLTRNSIHTNDGMGIDLRDGANGELTAPAITQASWASRTVTGTACAGCTVEIFSDYEDEGRTFEASTVADGSGQFSAFGSGSMQRIHGAGFSGPFLTATAIDDEGNTSECSKAVCILPPRLYLPLVTRS